MPSESPLSSDLLDLKLLPSWVKEGESKSYDHYTGDEGAPREGRRGERGDGGGRSRGNRPAPNAQRPTSKGDGRGGDRRQEKRPGRDGGRPPRTGGQRDF